MKKLVGIVVALGVLFLFSSSVWSGKTATPLKANEKKIWLGFKNSIPKDKWITAKQFHKVWQEILAGKRKAYMIDVRTDSEFNAFHIEGTDHIQAGHWYIIPKKIKDPNAEIYIFCRTKHRAVYVTGFLYKCGYKNVYIVDGGVLAWAKAGYPFVNRFTGEFKLLRYRKSPSKKELSYRIRLWDYH